MMTIILFKNDLLFKVILKSRVEEKYREREREGESLFHSPSDWQRLGLGEQSQVPGLLFVSPT